MARFSANVVAQLGARTLQYNRAILEAVRTNQELLKSMVSLRSESEKSTKKTDDFRKSWLNIKSMIDSVISGIKRLTNVVIDLSNASSRAEEIQQKFNVVFRHNRVEVQKWADALADSVNRSSTEIEAMAAHLQNTFVPLGFFRDESESLSKELVQLTLDLSSFNDLPTARVIDDIRSALLGNIRAVRKYGVSANETAIFQEALMQGWVEEKSEIDAVIKARAINNIILRSTKDAQDDLRRTMEQTANVRRAFNDQVQRSRELLGGYVNIYLTPIRKELVILIEQWNKARESRLEYLKALKAEPEVSLELAIKGAQELIEEQEKLISGITVRNERDALALDLAKERLIVLQRNLSLLVMRRGEEEKRQAALAEELRIEDERRANELKAFEEAQKRKEKEAEREIRISEKLMEVSDRIIESQKEGEEELAELKRQQKEQELKDIRDKEQAYFEFYTSLPTMAQNVFSSISSLFTALGAKELAEFQWANEQEEKIREETFEAEKQRIEESIGDRQRRNQALRDLEEEYAKEEERISEELEMKRREMQYESALQAWRFNILGTIAAGAQAQINTWTQTPFILPVAISSSALAATITALQLATINANKPVKNFQTGTRDFVVPEGYPDDSFNIGLTSGERFTVETPTSQIGAEDAFTQIINVYFDRRSVAKVVNKGVKSRDIEIHAKDILP